MFGIYSFVLIFLSIGFAEVTNTKELVVYQDSNGQYRYRFEYQRREVASEPPVVDEPAVSGEVAAQTRGTYYRGPSSGNRTSAIVDRGGIAAQQICGGPLEIVNTSGQCRELEYDEDFLKVLQTDGLSCVRSAANEAFGFTPTSVKLKTGEGQVSRTRRSSNGKVSTHAVGRALDVFGIEIYNGSAHNTIAMHGSHMTTRGHRTFYMSFGNCWRGVVDNMQARGVAGACGSGCLDFNYNSAHWDHMHISLPPTQTNRSNYRLNCT